MEISIRLFTDLAKYIRLIDILVIKTVNANPLDARSSKI